MNSLPGTGFGGEMSISWLHPILKMLSRELPGSFKTVWILFSKRPLVVWAQTGVGHQGAREASKGGVDC